MEKRPIYIFVILVSSAIVAMTYMGWKNGNGNKKHSIQLTFSEQVDAINSAHAIGDYDKAHELSRDMFDRYRKFAGKYDDDTWLDETLNIETEYKHVNIYSELSSYHYKLEVNRLMRDVVLSKIDHSETPEQVDTKTEYEDAYNLISKEIRVADQTSFLATRAELRLAAADILKNLNRRIEAYALIIRALELHQARAVPLSMISEQYDIASTYDAKFTIELELGKLEEAELTLLDKEELMLARETSNRPNLNLIAYYVDNVRYQMAIGNLVKAQEVYQQAIETLVSNAQEDGLKLFPELSPPDHLKFYIYQYELDNLKKLQSSLNL